MSNYSKTTDFEAKDSLPTGDSGKIIRGAEFETEFDAISTAIATKADTAGPTFTGTLTFETISDGTIGVTAFVDEDDMSSDSATLVPTQQSVKAYVDSVTTELEAQDLDFQADSGGALSIDLDTETMTFTGGTGITTTGLANDVTFAIDSTVATLTGTQTLTNKTLTSPDVDTPDIDGGTIDGTVIGGTTPAAVSATTVSATGNITVGGTVDGRDVATDGTKLDGIEAGATADQTAAEIRTLIDSATDSNVFTDADHTKLDGIEANATADQTAAEIRTLVDSATDSNVFTDADHTKLDGIEASADVTDTTNVTAAGALMDSELTNLTAVKSLDQGVATTDSPTFAGLTTTADVSFGDNDKAIFGAGSDLQIYHDGLKSIIYEGGTGELSIRANGPYAEIMNGGATKTMARFNNNGSVDLYYDNALKLATTSTGIDVTGTVTADGLTVDGNGSFTGNFEISGLSPKIFLSETDTTDLNTRIRNAGGNLQIQTVTDSDSSPTTRLGVDHSTGDISFYEDTGTTAKFSWSSANETIAIGTGASSTATISAYSRTVSASLPSALRIIENTGASAYWDIGSNNGSSPNLNFYVNANTTPKVTFASSGNVGIGTDSPDALMHLSAGSTSTSVIRFESTDTSLVTNQAVGVLEFEQNDATSIVGVPAKIGAYAEDNHGSVGLRFYTGIGNTAEERVRIDHDGNLLVGKTAQNLATEGISINPLGYIQVTEDQSPTLYLNRLTTDGSIVNFYKDGTTVGSIGSNSGAYLYIASSNNVGGIGFYNNSLRPVQSNGNVSDADQDLGNSAARWKDLYLSGGAYLGGTAAANKLDDYEEGTWTPTLVTGGWTLDGLVRASYTKIGNTVHVRCYTGVSGTGNTAALVLGGLPFTANTNSFSTGIANLQKSLYAGTYARVEATTTTIAFYASAESTSTNLIEIQGSDIGSGYIIFSVTYETT